jgi:hypothetical protein
VPSSGKGFVTKFRVRKDFLEYYNVQIAGGKDHLEYWIPAEELDAFNETIVGLIAVTAEFS